MPTFIGGWITICHWLLILAWSASALPQIINPSWTVNQWTVPNVVDGRMTPMYEFEYAYFIPTFSLTLTDVTHEKFFKNFGAYYEQQLHSTEQGSYGQYYNITLCKDTPYEPYLDGVALMDGLYCPDLNGETIKFQTDTSGQLLGLQDIVFNFNLEVCSVAAGITGAQDCEDDSMTDVQLDNARIFMTAYYLMPSGDESLPKNQTKFSYFTNSYSQKIDNYTWQIATASLEPTNSSYSLNWFMANLQQKSKFYINLDKVETESFSISKIFKFSYIWSLNSVVQINTWTREDLISKITSIGGLMAVITPIFGYFYQAQAALVSNSAFFNALYKTVDDQNQQDAKQKVAQGGVQCRDSSYSDQRDSLLNQSQSQDQKNLTINPDDEKASQRDDSVLDWLTSTQVRIPFTYSNTVMVKDYCKNACCCCLTVCGLCKQSKQSDRFSKAQKKFFDEIDIVNIVRQLRNHQFLLENYLKPTNLSLVSYFNDYFIDDNSASDSDDNSSIFKSEVQDSTSPKEAKTLEEVETIRRVGQITGKTADNRLSRRQSQEFYNWCIDMDEQLRLMRFKRHFDPENSEADQNGMRRVLGAPKLYPDVDRMKSILGSMVDQQLQSIREREKQYRFLSKIQEKNEKEEVPVQKKSQDEEVMDQIFEQRFPGQSIVSQRPSEYRHHSQK